MEPRFVLLFKNGAIVHFAELEALQKYTLPAHLDDGECNCICRLSYFELFGCFTGTEGR